MMKRSTRSIFFFFLLAGFVVCQAPAAPSMPEATTPSPASKSDPGVLDADHSAITHHALKIDKKSLEYTATAASITVTDNRETPTGRIFYIAYRVKQKGGGSRPLTFVFNGGPGAASAYLHLGALGPRRVVFNEDGSVPSLPAQIRDNPQSWLAFTDLVFVDPVGTGYSRAVQTDDNKNDGEGDAVVAGIPGTSMSVATPQAQAWGVQEDTDSLARFIRTYLTREDRWLSPIYLAGESYGGFRVARLSKYLQSGYGIAPSGLILISPALDFEMLWGNDRSLWPWVALIPSYAAVAAVHGQGGPDTYSADNPRDALSGVEHIALTEYLTGLASGTLAPDWLDQIGQLTGLDADTLSRSAGRIPIAKFVKKMLADQHLIVSLYDGSVTMVDPDPSSQWLSRVDPYLDQINAHFTATLNRYVRSELEFKTDLPYLLLNMEVNRSWNWRSGINGQQGFVEAVEDLKDAMSTNPDMRTLIVHGAYDLVTPYFSSEIAIRQMGLHPQIKDNIKLEVYAGGHMPYLRLRSLEAMFVDAEAFYQF
jgi:carboxypeptidase C (cathepsin A)